MHLSFEMYLLATTISGYITYSIYIMREFKKLVKDRRGVGYFKYYGTYNELFKELFKEHINDTILGYVPVLFLSWVSFPFLILYLVTLLNLRILTYFFIKDPGVSK